MRIYFWLMTLLLASCYSTRPAITMRPQSETNIVSQKNEKGEYELIIIDPGFSNWFTTNSKPVDFYSLSYYKNKNINYVNAWNNMVSKRSLYRDRFYPFESYINYDPNEDYGIELEYQLYYYFKYVEATSGRKYNFPYSA